MCGYIFFNGSTYMKYAMIRKSYPSGIVYFPPCSDKTQLFGHWQDRKNHALLSFRGKEENWQQILGTLWDMFIYGDITRLGHTDWPIMNFANSNSLGVTPLLSGLFTGAIIQQMSQMLSVTICPGYPQIPKYAKWTNLPNNKVPNNNADHRLADVHVHC